METEINRAKDNEDGTSVADCAGRDQNQHKMYFSKAKWDLTGGWQGGDTQGEKLWVWEESSNKSSQPNFMT